MEYSEELYQQTREEMLRLKSELKQYREWSASAGREFLYAVNND